MRRLGGLVLVCALTGCGSGGTTTGPGVTVTMTTTVTATERSAAASCEAITAATRAFGSSGNRARYADDVQAELDKMGPMTRLKVSISDLLMAIRKPENVTSEMLARGPVEDACKAAGGLYDWGPT